METTTTTNNHPVTDVVARTKQKKQTYALAIDVKVKSHHPGTCGGALQAKQKKNRSLTGIIDVQGISHHPVTCGDWSAPSTKKKGNRSVVIQFATFATMCSESVKHITLPGTSV